MTIIHPILGLLSNAALLWAGLGAVSVPIIIHLLARYRRRRQLWGAMRFLAEAFRKQRARLQLEQIILLFVRCLILAVLGLALAGPILTGCADGVLQPMAQTGRLLCVVIDDSLSSRATEPGGQMRFDQLRRNALELIDSLDSADRVAIWRCGRPAEPLLAPATLDHGVARRHLERMTPRYSRADLPDALNQVATALADPASNAREADTIFVVVLSDFAAGSLPRDRLSPPQALPEGTRFLAPRPAESLSNVQIATLRPRRHLVLSGTSAQGAASVPMELILRRFAGDSADRVAAIELAVLNPNGSVALVETRQLRWSRGQNMATLNVELDLSELDGDTRSAAARRLGGRAIPIRARVERVAGDWADALEADNQAFAVVEMRRKLRVGVVDADGGLVAADAPIPPRRWLTLALEPLSPGAIELTDLPADGLGTEQLDRLDAVFLLRPDRLADSAWSALGDFVRSRGMLWCFVPSLAQPESARWGPSLIEQFDLDWRVGIEMLEAQNGQEMGWHLLGDSTQVVVPEPLQILASDFAALLRPIRVKRRIDIQVGAGAGADQNVWLRINNEARSPLLVAAGVGDGTVLLLGTALNPQWTNLPTKPLFIPLLHESLRSVVGESPRLLRLSTSVCGDQPRLDQQWSGAQRLVLKHPLEQNHLNQSVQLQHSGGHWMPLTPLHAPGVYGASPESAGRRLALNVEAAAGDTAAIELARLEGFLNSISPWQWLDRHDVAAVLAAEPTRIHLARPLLWAVLSLALIETVLARLFSHAAMPWRKTLASLTGWLHRLRGAA